MFKMIIIDLPVVQLGIINHIKHTSMLMFVKYVWKKKVKWQVDDGDIVI